MATNIPPPSFTARGFIAPTQASILLGAQADINDAFGGGLNPALETPQGQISSSWSSITADADDTFCLYTNLVDPAFSFGRMQDAIGRIYFIERKPALPTLVDAVCTGLPGVPIPAGSLAQTVDDVLYISVQDAVIGVGGNVTITFSCTTLGPVPCAENTLTRIQKAIPGWDSINNPTDGVIGRDVENRSDFEARRAASVAKNSLGAIGSVIGAVADLSDVIDYYGYDNGSATPKVIGTVTIDPNTIFICVSGSTDQKIGKAILSKKGPGCGYTGNTTVTVSDNNPLYSSPVPYDVTFERPDELEVYFTVNLLNNPQVPSNAVELIQDAIINAFSGGDGGTRARIASTLFATRYTSPVILLGSWAQVISLKLGSTNTPSAVFTASIAGSVMTVSAVASGTLAIGQVVEANGVPEGLFIASLGTGAGGTGTYNLDVSGGTVSSRSMKTVSVSRDTVVVEIDQIPVTSSDNIRVILT